MSWEQVVRTGHPQTDQQQLGQLQQMAAQQGLVLSVQPLPQGGYMARATAPAAPPAHAQPPMGYGQAPPGHGQGPAGYGHAPPAYAQAPAGYGQAPPGPAGHGPSPTGFGPAPAGYSAPPAYAMAGYGAAPPAPNNVYGAYGAPPALHGGPEASAADTMGPARVVYLRKVYGLLAAATFLAIGVGAATIYLSPTERVATNHGVIEVPLLVAMMLQHPVMEYGAFGLLFVSVFLASAVSKVKGLNVAALFGVALLMGVELAPMVFVAQILAGLGETLSANPVRDSFAMVGSLFVGLTGYVFVTRKDFSYLKATLSMGFFVVLAGVILAAIVGSEPLSLAVASVGAILSVGFLLYQTSYIFRNSEMDDPVGDALGVLVQLRNLLIFVLRIAMSRR